MKYQVKDASGNIVKETDHSGIALSYYYTIRNKTGYSETWYRGKCIFKTDNRTVDK